MIGIIAGEDWTVFEFKPFFAGKCKADFAMKLPNFTQDDTAKEYGFALSSGCLWVMTGDETRGVDCKILKYLISKR
jgi:hypothetical protein